MHRPVVMVAPNGARRLKTDHAAVPVTVAEIAATAAACRAAGADAIHAHVRDTDGRHVLDIGLYRELVAEIGRAAPRMVVQVTTEAAGRYGPAEQMALVRALRPQSASVALREITAGGDAAALARFFAEAEESGTGLQHIVYDPAEIGAVARLQAAGVVPATPVSLLVVLGTRDGAPARPEDLDPFLAALEKAGLAAGAKFMAAAFGRNEIACLVAAARAGGDCRVGFENNTERPDGTPLTDNAESVAALVAALAAA